MQFVFLLGFNAAHQSTVEDEELFQIKAVFHLPVVHVIIYSAFYC